MFNINACGESCPKPVLMTKSAVASGETEITTLVDNKIAVSNLERFAKSAGFDFSWTQDGENFAVTLVKSSAAQTAKPSSTSLAIFVTDQKIGTADNELGTNLMRMYFYTLTQMDTAPSVIALMNEGVLLACKDEQIVGSLKALETAGTKVLVCGTCLNFYDVSSSLGCGIVSNMYEILEAISACSKVMKI